MSWPTRRPKTARIRMFASRTIISAGGTFCAATELLKFGDEFVLINIGKHLGKPIGSSFELGKIGGLGVLSAGGNVDAQGFTAAGDGNRGIRFEKTGNAFAKLTHADFN